MQKKSTISLLLLYLSLGCTLLYSCSNEPASMLTPNHITATNNHLPHILPQTRHKKIIYTYSVTGRRYNKKKYYKRGNRKKYIWRLPDAKDFFSATPQSLLSTTEAKLIIQEGLKTLSFTTSYALNRGVKKLENAVKQYGSSKAILKHF